MENRKHLKINPQDLFTALEGSSLDIDSYFDLETGDVLYVSDDMDDEDSRKLKKLIESDKSGRYRLVPGADTREGYRNMKDFIGNVTDGRLAEMLESATRGKGAFRRFKEVLFNYPEDRENWFRFKNDRLRERAVEWLGSLGVTLEE